MAQPPDFPLFLTDGDDTHLPNEAERQQDYKTTDDYGLSQKALSNFAIEMMRKLDRKADKGESEKHCFFVTMPAMTENPHCVEFGF